MFKRRPRPGLKPAAAVAAFGAAGVAIVAMLPLLARTLRRVEVAGASMSPALEPGDFVVIRRGAPPRGREYGHIVAVRDPRPERDGRMLLKRVVGLPGESLRVGGGPVQINGRVLIEPYARGGGSAEQHRGINRLGHDELFLIGDRRDASTDSRDFGPVRREDIEGTAICCYWPAGRLGWLRPPTRQLAGPPEEAVGTSTAVGPGRVDHDSPIPVFRSERVDPTAEEPRPDAP